MWSVRETILTQELLEDYESLTYVEASWLAVEIIEDEDAEAAAADYEHDEGEPDYDAMWEDECERRAEREYRDFTDAYYRGIYGDD